MLQIGKQLTPEQRLSKAVVDAMGHSRYMRLASVLMIGNRSIEDGIPTACTDGRNEWYGREFITKLNDAELRFLVLHECYHKLYRHLFVWEHLVKDDSRLANVAMDMVINTKLVTENEKDLFATMTGELSIGCYDKKYEGWDTAMVYHDLKKNGLPKPKDMPGGSDVGTPTNTSSGDGTTTTVQGHGGFDTHDHENAKVMSEKEKKDLAKDIDEAIRQGAMIAGKMGSGGDRDFDELLKAKIDWKQVLRDFITTTCKGKDFSTWNRPNRRFIGQGIYMPSGISEKVGELVIAIDTSGSIGDHELQAFLSEVKGIVDNVHPDKVRMLYWDTKVCKEEIYETQEVDKLIQSTKPEGGGGTTIECVPEHLAEHNVSPQATIILTDGYLGGSWGQWTCPTLWCIIDNASAQPDVGKCVHINSHEL